MKLSAVIFDLDDTLYNEADYVDQALAHTAEYLAERVLTSETGGQQHGGEESPETHGSAQQSPSTPENVGAEGNEQLSGKLASRYHARLRALLAQFGRGKIFDLLCEEEHLNIPIADLVAAYRATQPQLTLYPDAEDLLQTLTAAHIRTAVITDGCSAVQHAKLSALHLEDRLDYCLVTDDIGLSKPAPEVYARTLAALACPADHAAYIGDNPHKDFTGAKALGLHTFRIVRPTGMHMQDTVPSELEADYTIHSLAELLPYLNLD